MRERIRIIRVRRLSPERDERFLAIGQSARGRRCVCPDSVLSVPNLVVDCVAFGGRDAGLFSVRVGVTVGGEV